MKKYLFLLLLVSGALFSQTRQNEIYYRGDKTDFSFYYTDGDVTATRLRFVVKEDFKLSSPRLVQKGNALAGGDSTQLEALYSNDTTFITVHMLPTDMDSLEPQKYRYDLVSIDTADTTNSVTIFAGVINLKSDVQTPYDGVPVGNDYNQWNSFAPGSILIVDTLGGEKFLSSAEPGSEELLGYERYIAIVNQTGDPEPPEAIIMHNTLDSAIVWSRVSTGRYRGTLPDAFPTEKTFILIRLFNIDGLGSEKHIYGRWFSTNIVELNLYDGSYSHIDGMDAYLMILVFP
jgi:hypothetical protein